MSHFTVLVVSKDPDDVEHLLAPFDENKEVEPYDGEELDGDARRAQEFAAKMATDTSPKARGGYRPLTDEERADYARVAQLDPDRDTAELLDWYHSEGTWRRREDGVYVRVSTYNPDSKWDWWTIGGRWADKFVLNDGFAPEVKARLGDDGRWHADQAQVRDIDFNAMREERRLRAIGQLTDYVKAVEEHGPVPSRAWTKLDHTTEEWGRAKEAFWNHPTVKQIGLGITGPFEFDDLDLIEKSPDGWVQAEATQAVVGWAVLTHEGHWMEQGEMGWFGMSDTTMNSRIGYLEAARAYVDSLDGDMWLTNCDVHI